MGTWNPVILDTLIAPGVSSFQRADVPDVSGEFPQAEYWLANHFLNTAVFGRGFRHGYRQVVVGYLRRAQHAHNAYCDARRLTQEFLQTTKPGNLGMGRYYSAVAMWETFALQCSMAMDLFRWLNGGDGAFSKNDGSKEWRLYTIANHVKHTASASCVSSGQCAPEETVPLWLSVRGLESFSVVVTYEEAAEVLRDVCRLADDLENPAAFASKVES